MPISSSLSPNCSSFHHRQPAGLRPRSSSSYRRVVVALLILGDRRAGHLRQLPRFISYAYPAQRGQLYRADLRSLGIIGGESVRDLHLSLQFRDSPPPLSTRMMSSFYGRISTRLRPKLMTALGAIIALMPLALGIGTGAPVASAPGDRRYRWIRDRAAAAPDRAAFHAAIAVPAS